MGHMLQSATRFLGDVQQGRENEMLHARLLGYIGDIFAVREFGFGSGCAPFWSRDEEDRMTSLDGFYQGVFRG